MIMYCTIHNYYDNNNTRLFFSQNPSKTPNTTKRRVIVIAIIPPIIGPICGSGVAVGLAEYIMYTCKTE